MPNLRAFKHPLWRAGGVDSDFRVMVDSPFPRHQNSGALPVVSKSGSEQIQNFEI
jgi:hypothetical protein